MLKTLYVKNFALIDQVEVQFEPGLNIITGETGAGKSILIDALGSTLGEKIEGDSLRDRNDRAVVEAVFTDCNHTDIGVKLKENELEQMGESLILRKEVHQSGRNRAFVNDTPVTVNMLTDFGDLLVDLHGQHEHQALLKVKYHIQYLDNFGGFSELLHQVQSAYHTVMNLVEELNSLREKESSLKEKKEVYQFQINEISQVNPHTGEEDELIQEEKILRNSEQLFQITNELYQKLYDEKGSALEIFSEAAENLEKLSQIDNQFESYQRECQSAQIIVEEMSKFLQSYNSNIAFEPDRLQDIRERLAQFSLLKKKYGGSIEDVLAHKQKLESELTLIENLDETIIEKVTEIDYKKEILSELSIKLSGLRKSVAENLQRSVEDALTQLGMPGARFTIHIEQQQDDRGLVTVNGKNVKAGPTGIDHVEFMISANPGEELKALVKVASGGEVSRIMLALKSALAEADRIPVLIFDEIDIGISGRIAQAVGRSLKKLARTHQVICITHLPQIASMSDHHYVVEKHSDNNRSYTDIRKLPAEERALEIAKLLGGEQVTETHIQSAKELIAQVEDN